MDKSRIVYDAEHKEVHILDTSSAYVGECSLCGAQSELLTINPEQGVAICQSCITRVFEMLKGAA